MRSSRSFTKSRRGYVGANGSPCGPWSNTCIERGRPPGAIDPPRVPPGSGRPCPPQKACPPQGNCPPQRPCPPKVACPPAQVCPPQRPCPPQKDCPEHECPECEACPEHECPECPEHECPECDECPEYECEDACATLHGHGTTAYWVCVRQHCDPWTGTTVPPPGRVPPPTMIPPVTMTFRPPPGIPLDPPDPECIIECRERYDAGEIDHATFELCLEDCCFAEKIAEGYSVDMANRLCGPTVPGKPTPAPTCEQRCRGQYGVGTQGYADCVRRNCTLTSTFGVSPANPPYIP